MQKVTDISVLDVDGKPYAVDSLTDEIKALVEVYNDWNRKEAEVLDELTRFRAARETLSRQIIGKVREHLAEEEEKVKAAEMSKEEEVKKDVVKEDDSAADESLIE